ncbi:MAG: signal peptide peptidase SppA [Actinomycetota bacterium]|nr:signal peptide peptidase SppA [Actinomycetota bacterium]
METRPAALVRQVRARDSGDETPTKLLLELDLSRGVAEAPPSTPVEAARTRHVPVLRHLVEGLRQGADDPDVVGLVAHIGTAHPSLAVAGELHRAVRQFRDRGKKAVCWSESYGEMGPGNVAYFLASAFDEIWLQPSGDVGLTGVVARGVFLREALDRAGISPQMSQRHQYKTAADTFLRSGMTEPHREMATRLAESAMETILKGVSLGRGLSVNTLRSVVERAPLHAEEAVEGGLVDRLGYRDEVYAAVREGLPPVRLRYVERYRKRPDASAAHRLRARSRPVVAVVQASGPIHLGRSHGGSPLRGRSVGADSLGAALRAARADDAVRAVVLRVDSPGGSYVASDALRREVLATRESGRTVVASMGSVAASGGYYIAMPADLVVADEGTITGSIGVLAGKQVVRDALQRFGVRVESVSVGRQAEMFSTQREFTADEWQRLETWLDRVYDDFTAKAAHDRGMDVASLREVAKGRVWTGADARERGLVDRLGGLDEAVDLACERAGLRRENVEVKTLPKSPLLQQLRPAQSSESPAAAAGLGGLGDGGLGDGGSLLDMVYRALRMPAYGVLTTPVLWDLR